MTRLLLVILLAVPCAAETLAVKFGKLWDGTGKVWPGAVVIIDGDRIRAVAPEAPAGARIIDLSSYTGIPGLIDAHVHMTQGLKIRRWPSSAALYFAQSNARKTLETGVTTVRNLHAVESLDITMRDLINAGEMTGPRMFVSGAGLLQSQTKGVAEVIKAVHRQIAAGADWIKMFGSTGSGSDVTGDQTFSFEEMKAAVETAHRNGKPIAIHSYGPDGARDAVRAGADSLEHATAIDSETIREMAARKIIYVPTIDHNRYYAENAGLWGWGPKEIDGLKAYLSRNFETARKAFRAGVRFAMGSDAVNTMFGENTRELEWFVKLGMSPEQALETATVNGAALLHLESALGKIAPGYFADLIAVEGDPLADITAVTRHVRWVMKGGDVLVTTERSRIRMHSTHEYEDPPNRQAIR